MRFKIDWACLIVGSKFTVLALFYFVFEGNFPSTSPPGGLYLEGLIFGGAYIRRGLSTEGNLRFEIDWASLKVGSKFTVFALFYFVFEGNFPSTSPRGAYIWRGDLTEGFLLYEFGGLIFEGAYTRRGLFSEFYGIL